MILTIALLSTIAVNISSAVGVCGFICLGFLFVCLFSGLVIRSLTRSARSCTRNCED